MVAEFIQTAVASVVLFLFLGLSVGTLLILLVEGFFALFHTFLRILEGKE